MPKRKMSTSGEPDTVKVYKTTLAKRILNSNLSGEDKIFLIQLTGGSPGVTFTPSVWAGADQDPACLKYFNTCSIDNDGYAMKNKLILGCPKENLTGPLIITGEYLIIALIGYFQDGGGV